MSELGSDATPGARLRVTLEVVDGVRVMWQLTGVAFAAGETLARLPVSIAGAPTVDLDGGGPVASDEAGALPLGYSLEEDADGEPERRWRVERASMGSIQVSYLARPTDVEPRAATPPLELRREGSGLSGAIKNFLVLPAGTEDVAFDLRWVRLRGGHPDWMAVSSLGESSGSDGTLVGTGLELLGDTYVMCGDLTRTHLRDGSISTWWLTPPGFDVEAFTTHLGKTYDVMVAAFDATPHPYRVFLRTHPHAGAMASAHPASFVMAVNPARPLDEASLYETIAHELVHEWLRLDGPASEITWFVEGAADYYSLVLPHREGIVDDDAFLDAVNLESLMAYANPRRHLSLQEASTVYFSDFLAHRLPYARGMFYLADLDARLVAATSAERSVDDIVRDIVARRRAGEQVTIDGWCSLVAEILKEDERELLDALVFTGVQRPGPGTFGPRFSMEMTEAPVLDVGFDASTFVTGRVRDLVPAGLAHRAGLVEGDTVELPRWTEAIRLKPDDVLQIRVSRGGGTELISLPLSDQTVLVPQWRRTEDRP